jgi:hypothetical protein
VHARTVPVFLTYYVLETVPALSDLIMCIIMPGALTVPVPALCGLMHVGAETIQTSCHLTDSVLTVYVHMYICTYTHAFSRVCVHTPMQKING